MIEKILAAIGSVRRTGQLSKTAIEEAVTKIVNETNIPGQPATESYAVLEYIKQIAEDAQKKIHDQTLKYIIETGEDLSMGVVLHAEINIEHTFSQDKQWADANRKYMIYKDALELRENFLKNLVKEAIDNNISAPLPYTKTTSLKPTFQN